MVEYSAFKCDLDFFAHLDEVTNSSKPLTRFVILRLILEGNFLEKIACRSFFS